MLPDFPEVKRRLSRVLHAHARCTQRQVGGPPAEIKPVRMIEGRRIVLVREDGSIDNMAPKRMQGSATIPLRELESLDPRQILERIDKVATEIQNKKTRLMYERITEAATEVGHVVNCAAGAFGADTLLDMWSRMQIDFDSMGRPKLPTLHTGPSQKELVDRAVRQLESDPQYRERFARLMRLKREEWRARESDRKLVE